MHDISVLLTGGTGFIGRHVLHRLLDQGAAVHATSRSEQAGEGREGITWHRLALSDAEAVDALVRQVRPEVVLHLASHVAGARDVDLVEPTFDGNLASTVHLLSAVERLRRDGGAFRRFVQVGSLEEPDADQPVPVPSSPYAAAKAAASAYGRMFHHLYGTPVTLARVFMVYGPGTQDERKLVPYTIRSLLAGDTPSFSSGTRPVDWVYVGDVAEGLVRLAAAGPEVDGRRVDLGTGTLTTIRGVVEEIFRQLVPDRAPRFGGRGDRKDEQVRRADVDATSGALGWHPTVELSDGIARTIDDFRSRPA